MKVLQRYIGSCTAVVSLFWLLTSAPVMAAEPVGITGIDARTGLVTAVNATRSRTIQFKAEAALLKTLKAGQVVYADLGTKQVTIHSGAVCCAIVNMQTGANGSQTGVVGSASMNAPGDPFGGGGPPRKVSEKDFPNCSTCADACKVCAEWGQECRCTQIASGSSPGTEDDTWSCHCTGAAPRTPRK